MTKLPWFRRVLKVFHPEGIPGFRTRVYNAASGTKIFGHHYELVAEEVAACCAAGKVIDIGTGPGRLLIALHRRSPQLALVGIDVSRAMVDRAKENLEATGLSRVIDVRCADAKHLPFDDGSVDAVVSTGSIHHWKDPQACLAEAYRVLKPGGHALVYDLVSKTPKHVLAQTAAKFGWLAVRLFWLHSFEEPFHSQEALEELAAESPFGHAQTKWVGLLCCIAMRKPAAGYE